MLPGENVDAYRVRIEVQTRRNWEAVRLQQETAQRAREDEWWRTAGRVVVGEVTSVSGWRKDRRGAEYRLVTLRLIAAGRGPAGASRLQLRTFDGGDACFGPQGPIYPTEGRLVLFARSGKLSDATILGWSNAGLTTHPETVCLLARVEQADE